jgi:hypothetical protein
MTISSDLAAEQQRAPEILERLKPLYFATSPMLPRSPKLIQLR